MADGVAHRALDVCSIPYSVAVTEKAGSARNGMIIERVSAARRDRSAFRKRPNVAADAGVLC